MSKQTYLRLVDIVSGRLASKNRYLDISCRLAHDLNDLVETTTVKFVKFDH